MRKCGHCNLELDLSNFYKDKRAKDGLRSWCKQCCSLSSQEYNQLFRDERLAKKRKYKAAYYAKKENLEKKKAHERERYRNDETFRQRSHMNAKKWRALNKRNIKNQRLQEQYGITIEIFEAMLNEQNGKCFICQELPGQKGLSVDHDHVTGKVRKLLCGRCNTALGLLKEDADIISRLLTYITHTHP